MTRTMLVAVPMDAAGLARLSAVSGGIEVVHRPGLPPAELTALDDPSIEILVAPRAPTTTFVARTLRWLQVPSAGVDHLMADPPWRDGRTVTNARGVYAVPIAEYVLGAVLHSLQPWSVWASAQTTRSWPDDDHLPLAEVARGRTAVIVGYGAIGREVARMLAALGIGVVAVKNRPERRADEGFRVPGTGDPAGDIPRRIVALEALRDVAADAHFLILTAPLTDATRGLAGAGVFAALPRGSIVINVGRGALVDEDALAAALHSGHLGGAVLDVVVAEPLSPDHDLWTVPRLTITPHVAGATDRFLVDLIEENLRRYVAGAPLLNRVDPVLGY